MDRVLVGDERTLARVERLLKRRFMGTGGIAVSATDDAVVIALRSPQLMTPGGGGNLLRWAKITSIVGNVVKAKFADAEGEVDPDPNAEFRVYVYATDTTGVTWGPALADASPKLVVGQYIQIVQMPPCGPARPTGWWLVGPPLSLTCVLT